MVLFGGMMEIALPSFVYDKWPLEHARLQMLCRPVH